MKAALNELRRVETAIGEFFGCSDHWNRDPVGCLKEIQAALQKALDERDAAERQLRAIDKALPEWKGTGRGRIETIGNLRGEITYLSGKLADCDSVRVLELESDLLRLTQALQEISKAEGRYSRDRLTHAENTIESMKEIALHALGLITFAGEASTVQE